MRMELPEHVKTIIQKLESHGYEAYGTRCWAVPRETGTSPHLRRPSRSKPFSAKRWTPASSTVR